MAANRNQLRAAGTAFVLALWPVALPPQSAPASLHAVARLEGPAGDKEVSGIVASRQWPGVFWVHNDSGDETRVYPVDRSGRLIRSARPADRPGVFVAGIANSDWEAIALDDSGHLIVADVGNNSNARRDLALHYVIEPEPTSGFTTALRSVFVRYPEQTSWPAPARDFNYDCEAVFTKGDTVYLITKHRSDTRARLYRLDDPAAGRVNVLTRLGDVDLGGQARAADASRDGRRLAVLTYTAVWVFEAASPGGDDWFSGSAKRLPFTGIPGAEGIAFDGADTLLVAAEEGNGHLYRVSIDAMPRVW